MAEKQQRCNKTEKSEKKKIDRMCATENVEKGGGLDHPFFVQKSFSIF